MFNTLTISLILIFLSGFFQGTFGLGMKRFEPEWEIFWLIFAIAGMICIPLIWALLTIPNVFTAIFSLQKGTLLLVLFYGFCWGATGMMFGIAINYLGVSLPYGISMGLGAAIGSIVPLLDIPGMISNSALPVIIIGLIIMLAGVVIITIAGKNREKIQSSENKQQAKIKEGKKYRIGLLLATISGVGAAMLNIGFTKASPAVKVAMEQGALQRNASLVAWIIVLFGGFLASLIYCIYLFIKNKSIKVLGNRKDFKRILFWSVLTAILWFAALGMYGQGAALMGRTGPVIGWTMFTALALIISNLWGIRAGEWKGADKPLRLLILGDIVLLISWILMGYANKMILLQNS
jgi:L-rhamnose-H+ transport protein